MENTMKKDIEYLQKLPKIELHCHLDGSMNVLLLKEMLKEQGILKTDEEILSLVQVEDSNPSLTEYLTKFDLPLQCLVTKEAFRKAVYGLLMDAKEENVIYMEIRFAPLLSCHENLSCAEIIEDAIEGIRDAEKEGILGSLIICAMRHHSVEQNLKLLEETLPYLGKGVCAMDLAGDESNHPTAEQMEVFEAARKAGMPITLHAGECGNPENIRISKNLGARRIGHGIALTKDKELLEEIKADRIGIEMCPTSNRQTKAVESFAEYPMREYLDQGLLVSLNTDNRTVSGTTITQEMELAQRELGITTEELYRMQRNAAETAFTDEETKKELLEKLETGWKSLL